MMDNNANETQSQFVVSYELLCLLKWLAENDASKLKKMISKSLSLGLRKELQFTENLQREDLEEMHHSIVEFLGLLEVLLHEAMSEEAVKQAVEKKLMPAIDHIDSAVCDDATVRSSIQKATAKSETHPELNPKELLFEELLKQWKPAKKTLAN